LAGVLSDAMRNYVLSHTTSVFKSSYQIYRTRAHLMKLAFGTDARDHDRLFNRLNDISFSKNPGAPMEITANEKRTFEKRKNVTKLCCDFAIERDKKKKLSLRNKLANLIKILSQLKLEENWTRYFERVDFFRA
jgi:hypothetical protein